MSPHQSGGRGMKTLFTFALAFAVAELGLATLAPSHNGLMEGLRAEIKFHLKDRSNWIEPLTGTADQLPAGVTVRR